MAQLGLNFLWSPTFFAAHQIGLALIVILLLLAAILALTPKQMLELGVFCGKYLTDCRDEFPASWFARAKLSQGRDCSLNYFRVDASQPLSEWRRKGWIHPDDPRGWFQWYCRYYLGRRMPDEDARQIKRWEAMKRHVSQVRKHCEPGDPICRPRQRQALLHWAYDSRIM